MHGIHDMGLGVRYTPGEIQTCWRGYTRHLGVGVFKAAAEALAWGRMGTTRRWCRPGDSHDADADADAFPHLPAQLLRKPLLKVRLRLRQVPRGVEQVVGGAQAQRWRQPRATAATTAAGRSRCLGARRAAAAGIVAAC